MKNSKILFIFLIFYALALSFSHSFRLEKAEQRALLTDKQTISLQEVKKGKLLDSRIKMAYRECLPSNLEDKAPLFLFHGSPPYQKSFEKIIEHLKGKRHIFVFDLPGFGDSSRFIEDYSIEAHALYLDQFLRLLHFDSVDLLGYSMGGGVAIELAERAPEKVRSLVLFSSIGVQEVELLGDYYLNHLLHGLQLSFFWLLNDAVPHFGYFDDFVLNKQYARNFYDSDQRPLKEYLKRLPMPTLILHGKKDSLVPIEAAEAHYRLIPQSEKIILDSNHFLIFQEPELYLPGLSDFYDRVFNGQAKKREEADAERTASSELSSRQKKVPLRGFQLAIVFALLFFTTFLSEDFVSILSGLLVVKGLLSFFWAYVICFLGIFVGDILLLLIGRYFGEGILQRPFFQKRVSQKELQRFRIWFQRRGLWVIFLSRFIPASRLPTFMTAGILKVPFVKLIPFFFFAVLIWVPFVLGMTFLIGSQAFHYFDVFQSWSGWFLLGGICFFFLLFRLILPLFIWRERRLIYSQLTRIIRWEFWPMHFFYFPVYLYLFILIMKSKGRLLFTVVNPAIEGSGFIGESKFEILSGLRNSPEFLAKTAFISKESSIPKKHDLLRDFLKTYDLNYPIVIKPDVGQRGAGVSIVRHEDEAHQIFRKYDGEDLLLQEYISGKEFGILYYRKPDEHEGTIFSITEKRFSTVKGDGKSTLEELILKDERAVCMAPYFFKQHERELFQIPRRGKKVKLVELGSHCRGALFLDGKKMKTSQLLKVIDSIAKEYPGFYFGRFDVKVPTKKLLKEGKGFKILELNGVTSEATHIYDPRNHLLEAYRVLFQQWRIIFEIGFQNLKYGKQPYSWEKMAHEVRKHYHLLRR